MDEAMRWNNRFGSAMWNPTTESPLRLEKIPDHRTKQRCDQCMHDARDEHGAPVAEGNSLGVQRQV